MKDFQRCSGQLQRPEAIQVFRDVFRQIEHNSILGLTLSDIAECDSLMRQKLIKCIVSASDSVPKILRPMLLLEGIPAQDDWELAIM